MNDVLSVNYIEAARLRRAHARAFRVAGCLPRTKLEILRKRIDAAIQTNEPFEALLAWAKVNATSASSPTVRPIVLRLPGKGQGAGTPSPQTPSDEMRDALLQTLRLEEIHAAASTSRPAEVSRTAAEATYLTRQFQVFRSLLRRLWCK